MASAIDARGSALWREGGADPEYVGSRFALARALLGADAVSLASRGTRPFFAVSRTGQWRVYLVAGAPHEANVMATVRCIAAWDAARTLDLVAHEVEALALAIALPAEAVARLRGDGLDVRAIARELRVPYELARARLRGSAPIRSARSSTPPPASETRIVAASAPETTAHNVISLRR